MKNEWASISVSEVNCAVCVMSEPFKVVHKNRRFHGFVFNISGRRDYCFSDGYVMSTSKNSLFYLPRGSSYEVKEIETGGCYAINFDADISDEPFCVNLKDSDMIKRRFKNACDQWKRSAGAQNSLAMVAIYSAIDALIKEMAQSYMSSSKYRLIESAVEKIDGEFLSGELSVSSLATDAGISEAYLRRIFMNRFGVSPKEYIIRKRMDYACRLLASRQFEVQTVAELCGYSEPCHFSREFKKRFGVSPNEY